MGNLVELYPDKPIYDSPALTVFGAQKLKLTLSAFSRGALAAVAAQAYLYRQKRQFLQYTTTSPAMQKRLRVTPLEPAFRRAGTPEHRSAPARASMRMRQPLTG